MSCMYVCRVGGYVGKVGSYLPSAVGSKWFMSPTDDERRLFVHYLLVRRRTKMNCRESEACCLSSLCMSSSRRPRVTFHKRYHNKTRVLLARVLIEP